MQKITVLGVTSVIAVGVLATEVASDTTLSGSSDVASTYEVRSGAKLTIKSRQSGDAEAVLPAALQAKVAFWLDANKNIVTDASGNIIEWLDARETDLEKPANATKAIVVTSEISSYPSETLTVSSFMNGKKYVDFGEYNVNKWMLFVRTDGGEASILSRKRLAFRSAIGYLGFGKTAGFVFGDVADPNKAAYIDVSGDNATCVFHKGAGGSGNDNIYGASAYAKIGETRVNGEIVNPFSTKHVREGWELFTQNGPYTVTVGSNVTTPYASTLFNQGNFKDESVAGGNRLQNRQGGGKVAEMIYFSDVLTQTEREQVEAYLRAKWTGAVTVDTLETTAEESLTIAAESDVWATDMTGSGAVVKTGDATLKLRRNGRLAAGPFTLAAGAVESAQKHFHPSLVALGGKTLMTTGVNAIVSESEGGAVDEAIFTATMKGHKAVLGGVADGVRKVSVRKSELTLQPIARPGADPVDPRALVGRNLLVNGGFEATDCGSTFKQDIAGYLAPWVHYAKNNVTSSRNASGGASKGSCNTWLGRQGDGPSYMQNTGCPEGQQFGFIQVSGATTTNGISQTIEIPADGLYRVSGWGRYRNRNPKYGAAHYSICTLSVLVDETEYLRHQFGPRPIARDSHFEVAADIFTFQPFAVEIALKKGSHTLHLVGTQPEGQNDVPADKVDRAIALDDIRLELVKPGDFVQVPNGGFDNHNRHESYTSTGALSNYQSGNGIFRQGGTATVAAAGTWSFTAGAGIAFADGAWYWTRQELDAARRDKMVGFIQNNGSISQTVTFPKAGKVCIQFRYANRTRQVNTGSARPAAHNIEVSLGDELLFRKAITDDTMRLASMVTDVESGEQKLLSIANVRTDTTKDVAVIVDDVTIEYLDGLTLGEGATTGRELQDVTEIVLENQESFTQAFTTTENGPQLLTLRLRGKPLDPATTYQSHLAYAHKVDVSVDDAFVVTLSAEETLPQIFEVRLPYLGAGDHTLTFAGAEKQTCPGSESRLSDITVTPLTTDAMMNLRDVKFALTDEASLNLDFAGRIKVRGLKINGVAQKGTVTTESCKSISGSGALEICPDGLSIILR